ncbi:MAG TPA: hypothetical protein VMB72_07320, partial [Acidimicrobiales bacterium]|nr:hypothetical protein [Acidimicrobiales bacterium]
MTAARAQAHDLVAVVRAEVADDLASAGGHTLALDDRRELARQLTFSRLQHHAGASIAGGAPPLVPDEELRVAAAVLDALFGLGRLQSLIDDEQIENIDVNG